MMTPNAALPASAWIGQLLLYALFALAIGVFSRWPSYQHIAPDQALIKLSFTHTGKPVGECKAQSQAELAKLPPNMRAPIKCPRERSPVTVEVDIGGVNAMRRSAPPTGLSRDGASAVYQRLVVPAGEQRIAVRLNDDARQSGFAYQREVTVKLAPAQVLVIDFDAEKGGITLQ
ncbi:MAG: hypothetical protein Q8L49_05920 [Burkholderiaceae bacterium]|nr:hypothetical protein [Burkholderiaceae bacterium]